MPVSTRGYRTQATLTQAPIDVGDSGANVVIAGVAQQTIRVHRLFLVVAADVDITVKSGTTPLTGAMSFKAGGGAALDLSEEPWFVTAAGDDFVFTLSDAVQVSGGIYYAQS